MYCTNVGPSEDHAVVRPEELVQGSQRLSGERSGYEDDDYDEEKLAEATTERITKMHEVLQRLTKRKKQVGTDDNTVRVMELLIDPV